MRRSVRGGQAANGFALILVLWILVLLGAIGVVLLANARSETAIAHNVAAAASAEALADAGIARAVFDLGGPGSPDGWEPDGGKHRLSLAGGSITVSVQDEAWKINPNHASDRLLAALFETCGVDGTRARALGAAIADWVSPDQNPGPFGAKLKQYQAAGLNYGPPGEPFASLDELRFVLGMTPEILSKARPYLTLYTTSDQPDPQHAPALVRRALALAARDSDDAADTAPPSGPSPAKNAEKANAERIVSVRVTAKSRNGGLFVRRAVLRLTTESKKGYRALEWERSADQMPSSASD
jgi:general secretion pathway protein K